MAISKELAKKIAESITGGKQYTPPSNWYFGLSKTAPVDDMLSVGSEPAASTGYQRIQIPNTQLSGGSGSFTPANTSGDEESGLIAKITNAQRIEMNEITSGDEPEVQYFFLAESSENSNTGSDRKVSIWGVFDRPRKLVINSTLVIESGGAVFELFNKT